ncbi:MAG: hypothetical protein M3Y36_11240 [Actinomycetota bacterium]|nr:hypothetical protein [Actinomycetota bacterium]
MDDRTDRLARALLCVGVDTLDRSAGAIGLPKVGLGEEWRPTSWARLPEEAKGTQGGRQRGRVPELADPGQAVPGMGGARASSSTVAEVHPPRPVVATTS